MLRAERLHEPYVGFRDHILASGTMSMSSKNHDTSCELGYCACTQELPYRDLDMWFRFIFSSRYRQVHNTLICVL
jgi:hypothetical protein